MSLYILFQVLSKMISICSESLEQTQMNSWRCYKNHIKVLEEYKRIKAKIFRQPGVVWKQQLKNTFKVKIEIRKLVLSGMYV